MSRSVHYQLELSTVQEKEFTEITENASCSCWENHRTRLGKCVVTRQVWHNQDASETQNPEQI